MATEITPKVAQGISMGTAMAIVLSYLKWHSILWALLHGVFSWFYVIYYALYHN